MVTCTAGGIQKIHHTEKFKRGKQKQKQNKTDISPIPNNDIESATQQTPLKKSSYFSENNRRRLSKRIEC